MRSSLFLLASAVLTGLSASGCATEPQAEPHASPSSCSWDGSEILLSGTHVAKVEPVVRSSNASGANEETAGAEITVAHPVAASRLEGALRCYAARVDRERLLPLDSPLDVTSRTPHVSVSTRNGYLVVSVLATNSRDGDRILASAKQLEERARKRVGVR